MKWFPLLLPLLGLFQFSDQQCLTLDDHQQNNNRTWLGLYSGQQEFSLSLLNAINLLMPNENLFFSPYSTYHALLIAYFIAANQTEDSLRRTLRLEDGQNKAEIYNAYKLDKFTTMVRAAKASYSFTNANKIYVSDQVDIRDCMTSYFMDELSRAPFMTDPEGARLEINRWVDEQTHHMIKDLLAPGTITSSTNLALVNAAYFKGIWKNKFNTNETRPEIFYVNPSKQIMVDMMHVEGTFNHDVSEALGAHVLELPYEGDQISMYVFLPPFARDDAIQNTLKKLTLEEFKRIVQSNTLIEKTVKVAMPKFNLEQTIEMVPILESLGVGDLFESAGNFGTLSVDGRLSVGAGVHKARIDLNELGAHAAAATAFFDFRMMDDDDATTFICDRPFLFLLYKKETHTVLFAGIFRDPKS